MTDATIEQVEPGEGPVDRIVAPRPIPLAFIDGIRRSEAAEWYDNPETGARLPLLAGAYAVGAAMLRPGSPASFGGIRVGRLVIRGGGLAGDIISERTGHRWASESISEDDSGACWEHLQQRMLKAEGILARDAADAGWQVILDGPLGRVGSNDPHVVGYIKSHRRPVLPEKAHAIVPTLEIGQRTRMYRQRPGSYTCYTRVGDPRPGESHWSGIARLEFASSDPINSLAEHASDISGLLPLFAGVHHRDPRATVNLTPIKGLERRLSQFLGPVLHANRAFLDVVRSRASQDTNPS